LKRSKSNSYPAFFDSNIIKSLKLKDAARKRYKTSGSTVDCESFKAIRCKLKTDIRTAYSSYVKRMNSDIRSNPRQFWAFIEDKRKSNFIPSVMTYQSETITGPQEIVNQCCSASKNILCRTLGDFCAKLKKIVPKIPNVVTQSGDLERESGRD
jgi:hypothetical protein